MLDAAELATDPSLVMRFVTSHLGLASEGAAFDSINTSHVYNVAGSRGCGHSSAVPRGVYDYQGSVKLLDDLTYCTLSSFYAPFNKELAAMLAAGSFRPMSWLREGHGPRPALRCPGLWGAPLNISATQ